MVSPVAILYRLRRGQNYPLLFDKTAGRPRPGLGALESGTARPDIHRFRMIKIRRENGVEIDVETNNNPASVDKLLCNVLQPETYARMKAQLAHGGEEIFFEFTGVNKEEFPRLRYYLVHLDSNSSRESLSRGDFYIAFFVHKDHLAEAEDMAKKMKSRFKNMNDWNETNEHGIPANKFFAIPPMDIETK
jgi:hypothetical protein